MIKRLPYSSFCARVLLAVCVSLGVTWQAQAQISSPSDISNLVFWVDATDVNGNASQPADGSTVTNWADKSVGGNDLITQAGTATFEVTGFDGANPGIRLPDGARFLADNPFSGATQNATTIFFVNSNETFTQNASLSLNGSVGATPGRFFFHTPWPTNEVYFDADASSGPNRLQGPFPNALTETTLYTGLNDETGGSQQLRIDGQPLVSDTTGHTVTVSGGIRLGNKFNGRYAEVVIYDRALSQSETEDVECYLLLKWKPSNLPTTCTTTAVTNTNDSGIGSLRNAITAANSNGLLDNVTFDIPGTGPHVISPATPMPNITDNGVSIDGSTQSGASCGQLTTGTPHTLMIHLNGTSTADTGNARGLTSNANSVTVRGVSITGFQRQGVAHLSSKTDFLLDCAYIGVEPDGVTKGTNGFVNGVNNGVQMGGSTTSIIRNSLISGNDDDTADVGVTFLGASSGTLEGSIIGLNAVGTAAIGNGGHGVYVYNSSNITIGGTTAETRNIISSNGNDGIYLQGTTSTSILGNYIGLGASGMSNLSNGGHGVAVAGADTLNIGNGTAGGRNVIGSTNIGINLTGTVSTISINDNHLNTDVSGNSSIVTGLDGIVITGQATTLDILDNVFGQVSQDKIEFWNSTTSTGVAVQGNKFGVGADGSTNISGGIGDVGIRVWSSHNVSGINIGGTGAGEGNIIANSGASGIYIDSATTGDIVGNTIHSNGADGVEVISATAELAIYGNSINDNSGLGIDLGAGGVTANDNDDVDTGPNDLLNFPEINAITSDGATAITYDFDLDVPSDGNGYRIDFYKDSNALVTDNGQGEVHLGFVDITHGGGDLNFTGTFTALDTVSVGEIVSTTTTRKTGASSYDITSEFSGNEAVASPLVVTNTNDSGAGSLREAITFANANTGQDAITFAIPNAGPHVISVLSQLPDISDTGISIDGTTQSGALCGDLWSGTAPVIEIQIDDGGDITIGLHVTGDAISVKGLSVTGFARGLREDDTASNSTYHCNFLGLAPDGSAAGNAVGVLMSGANGVLGGLSAGDGNVIGGNDTGVLTLDGTSNATIQGNFIGTDPTGLSPRGNTVQGLGSANGTVTINEIRRNLISGNSGGLVLHSADIWAGVGGANIVIAGNYIGTDRTGMAALPNTDDGINFGAGSVSGVTIGGTTAADRNIISGNDAQAIDMRSVSNISILGNYIGTNVTGFNGLGNGGTSNTPTLYLLDVTDINIGNGTTVGRNIISDGTGRAIQSSGTATNLAINDNYIGTDITGNTALKNGTEASATTADVFLIANVNNLDILNNVIGPYDSEGIEFWSGSVSDDIVIQGNSFGVGADGTTPFASGRAAHGHILFGNGYTATNVLVGGTGAGEGNILANGLNSGISIDTNGGFTGEILGNQIYNNAADGIAIQDTVNVAIYQNAIYNNGGLGIDLSASGVSANDSGDGDTGPNNLLNFPVINSVSGAGTTMSYDIDLDTVSNANGYRIDFYANSAADPTGYGEGETHLGYIEVSHGGGNQTFTGTFTGTQAIAQGEIISATTTRKTGVSSYDATSEFSLAYRSDAATELTAAKSVDVFDPTSAGLYALPGNDIISSMTVTNVGNSAADADSIVIIDAVPSEMTFYNGDMDDGGPANQAVYFTQTGGANLTFTYGSDAAYSNSGSRPANMAGCTYTPSAGYDSNVTYVCFNPKGAMAAGNPDPTFTLQFRASIK